MKNAQKKNCLLLEVRVENIPARFVVSAERQLKAFLEEEFAAAGVEHSGVKAFGTYKRLAALAKDVPSRTAEKTELVKGPPAKIFKDEKGDLTPQSAGFARSQKVRPSSLFLRESGKGEFVFAEKKTGGLPVKDAAAGIFQSVLSRLEFPKTMYWEESRTRFARPVRSMVALHGEKIVSFSFAGVKSGRKTVGLSAKGSPLITVKSAVEYPRLLRNSNVVVDGEERRKMIEREVNASAARMGVKADMDENLLTENAYLVEYPVPVPGDFSAEYLKLPRELINLVLKKQLKFFPLKGENGELRPYFIGIRDGVSRGQKNVREGFKNVLEARLKDAVFFYEKDLSAGMEEYARRVKKVVFHKRLGTVGDKLSRIGKVSRDISRFVPGAGAEALETGIKFLFADNAGEVVKEFPDLECAMGYYYMKAEGRPESAAAAVRDYNLPVSGFSPLPSSPEGLVMSLAGKAETLVSFFAAGIKSSGSRDPYALRRQATGMARILVEKEISMSLDAVFESVRGVLPAGLDFGAGEREALLDFIWQRAEVLFQEKGCRFDEVRAAKDSFMKTADLYDSFLRAKALDGARLGGSFDELIMLFKRAKNIVRQAQFAQRGLPEESLFKNPEESALNEKVKNFLEEKEKLAAGKEYEKYLGKLAGVKPELDAFFDKVMVMVEDGKMRRNRLLLLSVLVSCFEDYGDMGQLQQLQP